MAVQGRRIRDRNKVKQIGKFLLVCVLELNEAFKLTVLQTLQRHWLLAICYQTTVQPLARNVHWVIPFASSV